MASKQESESSAAKRGRDNEEEEEKARKITRFSTQPSSSWTEKSQPQPQPQEEEEENRIYPVQRDSYTIVKEMGKSPNHNPKLFVARCNPLDEMVAIKIVILEEANVESVFNGYRQQSMILDHPNFLKAHCAFVSNYEGNDHTLWIVMPYVSSCLQIMRDTALRCCSEALIQTILYEILKALSYLHYHLYIYGDVNAGNILLSMQGEVKLADLCLSSPSADDVQPLHNTFVGTPVWMAPEVVDKGFQGYDFNLDIWSFGITALELAYGRAPFSKYPPQQVLSMTLIDDISALDGGRNKKFSESFKDMIAMCLVKEPSKRPSTSVLLEHPFFKEASSRSTDSIAQSLQQEINPYLAARVKMEAAENNERISQGSYKSRVADWTFSGQDKQIKDGAHAMAGIHEGSPSSSQHTHADIMSLIDEATTSSSQTFQLLVYDLAASAKKLCLEPPNDDIELVEVKKVGRFTVYEERPKSQVEGTATTTNEVGQEAADGQGGPNADSNTPEKHSEEQGKMETEGPSKS